MMMQFTVKLFTAISDKIFGVSVMLPRQLPHKIPLSAHLLPMQTWCNEMFGDNCTCSFSHFYFNTDEDRTLFILRWA